MRFVLGICFLIARWRWGVEKNQRKLHYTSLFSLSLSLYIYIYIYNIYVLYIYIYIYVIYILFEEASRPTLWLICTIIMFLFFSTTFYVSRVCEHSVTSIMGI